MKNNNIVAGIIAVVMLVLIGLIVWMAIDQKRGDDMDAMEPSPSQQTGESPTNPFLEEGSVNIGKTIDATGEADYTVHIDDFIFETTVLKVSKGTKVTWVNDGKIQHDVHSAEDSPKRGLQGPLLSNGETYSYTFNETGTYKYLCQPHPTLMRGIVKVVEE